MASLFIRPWCVLLLISVLMCGTVIGSQSTTDQYQSQEEFLTEAFDGSPPQPRVIWLKATLRAELKTVLGHEPNRLRIRYWKSGDRTAWILEEIGKTQPITTGVVIENHEITGLKVLIFRESRGWEIRHEFFTRQFNHLKLSGKNKLNKSIDGITGATLSVNAMRRVAWAALVLDNALEQKQ